MGRHGRPVALVTSLILAAGSWAATASPAAAEWQRTLTIDFFSNGAYGDGKGRVTSDDGGIDCSYDTGFTSGDCSEPYVLPDFLATYDTTLTLTPATGSYVCLSTTNLCQPGGGAQTFPVHFDRGTPGNITVTPSFNLRTFQVHVDVDGPGSVSGNGAFCPVGGDVDYCGEFKYGASANLTAKPDAGYPFNFWDGPACAAYEQSTTCTFVVGQDVALRAIFGRYYLTIHASDGGDLCVPAYSGFCVGGSRTAMRISLLKGTSVTAVATPASGWAFAHWPSGSPCAGQPATCTFVISGAVDLTATFARLSTPQPTRSPQPTPRPTPTRAASSSPSPGPGGTQAPGPGSTTVPGSVGPGGSVVATDDSASLETGAPAPSDAAPAASESDGPGGSPALTAAPGASEDSAPAGAPGAASGPDPMLLGGAGLLSLLLVLALGFAAGRRGRSRATPPRA